MNNANEKISSQILSFLIKERHSLTQTLGHSLLNTIDGGNNEEIVDDFIMLYSNAMLW